MAVSLPWIRSWLKSVKLLKFGFSFSMVAMCLYDWQLTLYFGVRLETSDGNPLLDEQALLRLVRLVWLRHGAMPDWLRAMLIDDLAPPDQVRVRDLLTE